MNASIAPNENITALQFNKLAKMVHQDSGIVLTEAKKGLLVARLSKRLRALNIPDFGSYYDYLNGTEGASERRELLSAITTNVTAFFREEHHFTALSAFVQHHLMPKARAGQRVRLWSSACSSGEEAYSIAMTLIEVFPEIARHDVLILATDIDPVMVKHAESGKFNVEAVQSLNPSRIKRFFTPDGPNYEAKTELRNLIRFAELNLHETWPFAGQFDVIFCRNVVIYFDTEHRQKLWKRFAEALTPNGQLFIGHSERVDGPASSDFDLIGATHYQR